MMRETGLSPMVIEHLIAQAERRNGFKLCQKDVEFLKISTVNFVNAYLDKFVAGAKRHTDDDGDFVSNVNHKSEMGKEILDLWAYFTAMKVRDL